jgi:23S rRNA pseudouridine2605 synthase
MGEATGFPVMRLVRASFAGISSDGLKPGSFRHLTREELHNLKQQYGVPKSLPAPVAPAEGVTRGAHGRAPGVDARGRARGKSAERPQPERAREKREGAPREGHEPTPRYGGGSPGRRGYGVKSDWGGGVERGRATSSEEAASPSRGGRHGAGNGAAGRGSSGGEGRPGGGPAGGRGRATRTTGTGGGIGASDGGDGAGYRMQRSRKR